MLLWERLLTASGLRSSPESPDAWLLLRAALLSDACLRSGMQPVLVHMSKTNGAYRYNPISVNLSVEVAKTIFAVAFLLVNVSSSFVSRLTCTAHVQERGIPLHLAARTVTACIHVACM